MTAIAMPARPPAERNNVPLSLCYSLALHVLLIALLGVLCMQTSLNSPADLDIVVVGLFPATRVNLGQATPSATTPLRNPDASDRALSAPQLAERSAAQQAMPQNPAQPQNPPLLSMANPEPFYAPSAERQTSQFTSQQRVAAQRQNGQQVATAPRTGPGANLPVHNEAQVSAELPITHAQVTMPQFIPSATQVNTVAPNTNPRVSQGSDVTEGVITSSRRLLEHELPPMPAWIEQSGLRPEVRYKVLMNAAGDIIRAEVYQHSGFPQLDEPILAYVKKWRYERGVGPEWRIIRVSCYLR